MRKSKRSSESEGRGRETWGFETLGRVEISLGQWGKRYLKKVVLFKGSVEGSGELMATNS